MSLCESVREIIEDQARESGFTSVTCVWMEIGPLSCVAPEALRFGFDVVMRGTVAEGAALKIATPSARARCPGCQEVSAIPHRFAACPNCGAQGMDITQGTELRVTRLEVE